MAFGWGFLLAVRAISLDACGFFSITASPQHFLRSRTFSHIPLDMAAVTIRTAERETASR